MILAKGEEKHSPPSASKRGKSFSSTQMDSKSNYNDFVEVTVKMLIVLQRKFPLPDCMKAGMINEQIFLSHRSPSLLTTNGIIYYLICIADPVVGRNIQWPIGTQAQAKFNSTLVKALTRLLKDHEAFHLSFRTSLGSILRDRKGLKFNKFIYELASNALRITNLNHGSTVALPASPEVPVDDRLETNTRNFDRLTSLLARKEGAVQQTQDEQYLDRLEQTKSALKKLSDELIQMYPSKYKELTDASGPVQQNLLVTDQWQADLNVISNEQSLINNRLASHNSSIEAIQTMIRSKLAGGSLVNELNGPILVKTARENHIELLQGDSVSLSGFMESSCIIADKLKTLVVHKDMQHLVEDFNVPLEKSSRTVDGMNKQISDGEQLVQRLVKQCEESRKLYEKGIITQGGHRFPLPDSELEMRADTPAALYSPEHLIHSPRTDSPKRVLEEVKQCRRDATDCGAKNDGSQNTPKSSSASNRSRNRANSSMSQLTKSVLQRQTLPASLLLASHANSTVGDMVPLSSSSPVANHGTLQEPPAVGSKSGRSSLADVLNDLEESNLSFWDLSEESDVMNSTFDSPEPPMIQPLENGVTGAGLSSRVGSRLPVPLSFRNGGTTHDHKPPVPSKTASTAKDTVAPSVGRNEQSGSQLLVPSGQEQASGKRPTTAPASSPARQPRRSIQSIVERLQRIKERRKNTNNTFISE